MSSEASVLTPNWQVLALKREIYLQSAPVWDIDAWVIERVSRYHASEVRRFLRAGWPRFRTKTLKAATKEREALMASTTSLTLHLEKLVPLLIGLVEDQVSRDADREGWDPDEKKKTILAGLDFVDTELTPRQREVFHLESVIGLSREHCAKVLGVTERAAGSHLCTAWKEMENGAVDVEALEWFLTQATDGRRRTKTPTKHVSEGE